MNAPTRGRLIAAAGTLPWRRRNGHVEVLLVHRPRYDDWSWPKGKLDPGETWAVAAVRETWEEAGLRVRLGPPLPAAHYPVTAPGGKPRGKEVHYWSARVTGGHGRLDHEIDGSRWLGPEEARDALTYRPDRRQLDALLDGGGPHETQTVVVVRHAKAVPRRDWDGGDDRLRPLDDTGIAQSRRLAPLLAAYGIERVVSSPSTRCADTVTPFLASSDPDDVGPQAEAIAVWSNPLSEEGFEADPDLMPGVVEASVTRGEAVALCSHGPVIPDILDVIAGMAPPHGRQARSALRDATTDNLVKGEALVLHLADLDGTRRIIAVERHLPHD